MDEKKISTIITYKCPAIYRNARVIWSIYEVIDALLNNPPKDYFESCVIGSSKDYWSVRVDLDEDRSNKLAANFVNKFIDLLDQNLLEINSNEITINKEHSDRNSEQQACEQIGEV